MRGVPFLPRLTALDLLQDNISLTELSIGVRKLRNTASRSTGHWVWSLAHELTGNEQIRKKPTIFEENALLKKTVCLALNTLDFRNL